MFLCLRNTDHAIHSSSSAALGKRSSGNDVTTALVLQSAAAGACVEGSSPDRAAWSWEAALLGCPRCALAEPCRAVQRKRPRAAAAPQERGGQGLSEPTASHTHPCNMYLPGNQEQHPPRATAATPSFCSARSGFVRFHPKVVVAVSFFVARGQLEPYMSVEPCRRNCIQSVSRSSG